MVTFLWPELLWVPAMLMLAAVARLAVGLVRRRSPSVASLDARDRAARRPSWHRHLILGLYGVALLLMLVATARPSTMLTFVEPEQTVILAMDVSSSMQAYDIAPTRIAAAQLAAKDFVERLPRHVRVGIVAYAVDAHLVQPPTLRRDDVCAAIDRFTLQPGTAIGSGILRSLAAIFPEQEIARRLERIAPERRTPGALVPSHRSPVPPTGAASTPGSVESAAIVLLTDGQNTNGPDPVDAAQVAAALGIRVYALGFGAPDGTMLDIDGYGMFVRLDEPVLVEIAATTRGEYFRAGTITELRSVYETLQSRLVPRPQLTEISALLAAVAAVVLSACLELSCAWFGRVI